MNDPYPSQFKIEIDRPRLTTYLRLQCLVPVAILFGFFALANTCATLGQVARQSDAHSAKAWQLALHSIGTNVGITALVAIGFYLVFCHWKAASYAKGLHVSAEGAFLRIRKRSLVMSDRKLHFRAIVDYATIQNVFMRWCGIEALQMHTTSGAQYSILTIPGIKDCLKVRDQLSDIDRLRENQ